MTTIATDGKTMSSDSQSGFQTGSGENQKYKIANLKVTKIHLMKDGSIIGGAGRLAEITRFIEWYNNPDRDEDNVPYVGNSELLRLTPDGRIWNHENKNDWTEMEKHWAIGSGADYALGALEAGATSAQAVRSAMRYDPSTGGTIKTLAPKQPKGK